MARYEVKKQILGGLAGISAQNFEPLYFLEAPSLPQRTYCICPVACIVQARAVHACVHARACTVHATGHIRDRYLCSEMLLIFTGD